MTSTKPRPEPEGPEQVEGEDLAALILRILAERGGLTQKWLAEESGIPYSTLNAWCTRRRGTTGVDPDVLRVLGKALGVPARVVFEAAGRRVPGPSSEEREVKLLRLYRNLSVEGQRALIQMAEAMDRESRASVS